MACFMRWRYRRPAELTSATGGYHLPVDHLRLSVPGRTSSRVSFGVVRSVCFTGPFAGTSLALLVLQSDNRNIGGLAFPCVVAQAGDAITYP
jgi:hypothetical protein